MKIANLAKITAGFKKAREVSFESESPNFKLGSVIMRKGKILSSGCNQRFKTHPYCKYNGADHNRNLHAELVSIFRIKNKEILRGATLLVYREHKNGTLANSRPCPMCMNEIKRWGIKKVIYTTNHGIFEEKV